MAFWGGAMKRLGKVSHYAKQGFLILRSRWVPALNDVVTDKNLRVVGTVKDVFGPVEAPYVAVKPRVKNPADYIGEVLYVDRRSKKPAKKSPRKTGRNSRRRPAPKRRG
jgi:RNA-binding protein